MENQVNDYDIVIMVGLPRSGKTTIAKSFTDHIRVCPDDVRLALHGQQFITTAEPFVWATVQTMARALLIGGNSIVIDATNTTDKRRVMWTSLADELALKHCFVYVDTPKDLCFSRSDDSLKPIIDRMSTQFEAIPEDEIIFTKK